MRKLIVRGVLVLALAASAVVAVAEVRMHRARTELESVAAEYRERVESADTTRPVLRGEPIEGFAHEEYAALFAPRATAGGPSCLVAEQAVLKSALFEDWWAYLETPKGDAEEAAALREALVDKYDWIFAVLARGARCTDARWELDRETVDGSGPSLLCARPVVEIVRFAAGDYMRAGQSAQVVDVLLDLLQFGGDLAHAPGMSGRMIAADVIETISGQMLFDDGLLDSLPPAQLRRLEEGLGRFESGLPAIRGAGDGYVADWAVSILKDNPDGAFVCLGASTIGEYMSFALMGEHGILDRFALLREWNGIENQLPNDSWRAWMEEAKDFREHVPRAIDPTGVGETFEMAQQKMRADLRIARTALEYRISGETLALADPFGRDLDVEIGRDRVRVTSCGPSQGFGGAVFTRDFALN